MKMTGTPALVGDTSRVLNRVALGKGTHDEAWLQALIFRHPELLPVASIEPGFGSLVPAACEVPCGHGYIDNLFVTPTGDIVIVEVKLWANPQARREVVAQALDYAAALSQLSYEQFEAIVLKGHTPLPKPQSLYALVTDAPDVLDESAFIDAVAQNLKRGRMLVLAAGDGIRSEAEVLASILQSHAGAHFTFALVELAAYRVGDSEEMLILPSTLLRTVLIERGVVRIENGQAVVAALPVTESKAPAQSISEAQFYELMGQRSAQLPEAIRSFIKSLEPLGVYAEMRASLNLKVEVENQARPINLGYIQKNGQLWTSGIAASVPRDIALRCLQTLAELIGGTVAGVGKSGELYVSSNGTSAPRIEQFLLRHADGWREAIAQLIHDVRTAQANLDA